MFLAYGCFCYLGDGYVHIYSFRSFGQYIEMYAYISVDNSVNFSIGLSYNTFGISAAIKSVPVPLFFSFIDRTMFHPGEVITGTLSSLIYGIVTPSSEHNYYCDILFIYNVCVSVALLLITYRSILFMIILCRLSLCRLA